ncbi:hypothetical protein RhiirA5_428606 [Rhizophagus irregularis]|uniref:Uncharacterized protein n=1 Tax=Rhizophagus irregularis TaxID=588596 RepID=A0A2N0NZZ6_9GLOM|nr:hypothetical protein RhiirA5_428606 [Rhizophagus irregularis]
MVPVPCSNISSSPIPETADEATINKERAEIYSFQRSLDNKFDHLSGSIERFISSISGGSSLDLVNKTSDIFNNPLSDTLFSSSSSTSPIPNSFNISSFNVNGFKTPGQGSFKMDQISSFFSHNHISFGGIVDTHLSPKQMKFLSKRVCDYTSFHSDLDSTKHGRSSGGVSLFIHNSLATHVQFYQSHSS